MGAEIEVGVLCCGVCIALCCEGNVAAIGEEHAVFLHGSRDDLCGRGQSRQVVGGLEAETGAHGRSRHRTAGSTSMGGRMDVDLGAHPWIGENKANGMVDASRGELVGIEEQRCDGESGGVGAGAPFSAPGRRIKTVEVPYREEGSIKGSICVVCLVGFVELAVTAVSYDEVAVVVVSIALIAWLSFHAAS